MREIAVALVNGLILSILLAVFIFVWKHNFDAAIAISIALMTVIVLAGITGTSIPLIFKALKQDPAHASGPFITMINDVVGLAVYLLVTSFFLYR